MSKRKVVSSVLILVVALAALFTVLSVVGAQEDTPQPYLGIGLQPSDEGALIQVVQPGSPADEAGLQPGDIITAVEGEDVTAESLRDVLAGFAVGDTISLDVLRDAETLQLSATLAARPDRPNRPDRQPFAQVFDRPMLGVSVENSDNGVVIRQVVPGSAAETAGLQVDDIITSVGDTHIEDARALVSLIRDQEVGDSLTLEIQRDGATITVDVTLEAASFPQIDTSFGIMYNAADNSWQIIGLDESAALYEAGLRQGDTITAFDGQPYEPRALRDYLDGLEDGASVTLSVERAGDTLEIAVPVDALSGLNTFGFQFNPGRGDRDGRPFGFDLDPLMSGGRLGVQFLTLDEQVAGERDLDLTDGALITEVIADSPAAVAGLQIDDIITAVNDELVDAEHTLRDRLNAYEPGDVVTLAVQRAGEALQLSATLDQGSRMDFAPFFGDGEFPFDFDFQFPQPPGQEVPVMPNL